MKKYNFLVKAVLGVMAFSLMLMTSAPALAYYYIADDGEVSYSIPTRYEDDYTRNDLHRWAVAMNEWDAKDYNDFVEYRDNGVNGNYYYNGYVGGNGYYNNYYNNDQYYNGSYYNDAYYNNAYYTNSYYGSYYPNYSTYSYTPSYSYSPYYGNNNSGYYNGYYPYYY